MKTYRIEHWDILGCPEESGKCHIGGQIYGHPDYADGTWVLSDHVVYFDNEQRTAQTLTSGLLQLGEMSDKMKKKKDADLERKSRNDSLLDAAGRPMTSALHDNFCAYNPDDWSPHEDSDKSGHQGVADARDALNDLLKDVFGRPGAPDKKRHH